MENNFVIYQKKVKNALDIYRDIRAKLEIKDEGLSKSIEVNSKPFLEGYFTLAVLGQMSSGKSTFINALLKDENLLPTGHFQTTCLLTEIRYADKKIMEVTYGNGHKETYERDSISQKLREIVAIPEKYEKLPINLINKLIISDISKNEIIAKHKKEIDKRSGISKGIDKELLTEYIEKTPKSAVAVKVVIDYPLPKEFEGWKIVDTPGVGAIGGIEENTKDFIFKDNKYGNRNVDAVIFLYSCKDNIESSAVNELINSTLSSLTDETKKRTFFILTHATDRGALQNKEKIKDKAIDFFANEDSGIKEDRIVMVDSLLSILNSCYISKKGIDPMLFLEKECPKGVAEDQFKPLRSIVRDIKNKIDDENKKEVNSESLTEEVKELSGFTAMHSMLNEFAKEEKKKAFEHIISNIKDELQSYIDIYNENIQLLNQKNDSSTNEIKDKIKDKIEQINIYKRKVNEAINKITIDFSKEKVKEQFSSIYTEFEGKIKKIDPNSSVFLSSSSFLSIGNFERYKESAQAYTSNCEEGIRKKMKELTVEQINSVKDLVENIKLQQKQIVFPKLDLEAYAKIAKKKNTKYIEVKKKGFWASIARFWGVGGFETKKQVNYEKQREDFKTKVLESLKQHIWKLTEELIEQGEKFHNIVAEQVNKKTEARKEEIKLLEEKIKEGGEAILKEQKEYCDKITKIKSCITKL